MELIAISREDQREMSALPDRQDNEAHNQSPSPNMIQ